MTDPATEPEHTGHITCSVCYGTNVQYQTWIRPNTNQIVGDDERTWAEMREAGLSYCEDCAECVLLAESI